MQKTNKVFIATSLDGFIADKDGGIAWLDTFPEMNTIDSGYDSFTAGIDALVMGRKTFETVCSFDIDWPYTKPVFVVSRSLDLIPEKLKDQVFLVKGSIEAILDHIHALGHFRLYIDGGQLIQSFLAADQIDELVITTIPVLLGDGAPLFANQSQRLIFECKSSTVFLDAVVQSRFVRRR